MARTLAVDQVKAGDTDLLKEARDRWKQAVDATKGQAEREREDIAFYDGEQWPADVKLARQGQQPTSGMPAVPSRPTLVINKVREPVRQVQNEIRSSDIGIELVPADDFGDLGITPDDTEVTLREGLIRRIQRESEAEAARNWAGDRATIAGRGYYMVMTQFLPGPKFDQEIVVKSIYNQSAVMLDPSHTEPDGSDADWGFIGTWMQWAKFKALYPNLADGKKNPILDGTVTDFLALAESYPGWYQAEDGRHAVRIVDYWYTEWTSRQVHILSNGTTVEGEKPKELSEGVTVVSSRNISDKSIKFCKIGGGILELEKTEWAGPDLPIVEVTGEQLQPYDQEYRAEGMVRPARDAQQGFNYMVSKQVETVGLTPIPPLQVDPEAIDGYEDWYKVANTRTLPFLPYRTYDDFGRPLKEPHRPPVDPNILPIAQSVALFDQAIKSTTAVPDPTLGNVDPSLKSGKAIKEVVFNAKQSTSNFLDNRVRSTRREGKIINNLLYPIYGQRDGRILQILTGEGVRQKMHVGDPQDDARKEQLQQQAIKVGKLSKDATFNLIVKVTRQIDARRQQEADALGTLIQADPALMAVFGDLLFLNSDIPGRKALAERIEVTLDPRVQAMLAQKKGQGPTPQMMQQQLMKAKEQIQHAEAAMQDLAKQAEGHQLKYQADIQTEQLKQDAETRRLQMSNDHEKELLAMKNAATIEAARIAAAKQAADPSAEADEERIALHTELAHDAAQAELDRQHERDMAQGQQAHDAAMGAMQADAAAQQPPAPEPQAGT